MKRGVPASIHLLGERQPHERQLALSYPLCSFQTALLLDELSHLPQAFQQEQGRFGSLGIDGGSTCVIGQTGGDRSMIAIRQTDNEVWVSASSDTNKLHALAVQRVVRVRHRHPFLRWVVKGGSVL
jgi:hypothetical protein